MNALAQFPVALTQLKSAS